MFEGIIERQMYGYFYKLATSLTVFRKVKIRLMQVLQANCQQSWASEEGKGGKALLDFEI